MAFRTPSWRAPFDFVYQRELTNVSHAFDAAVFGDDAWGHRLHNLLLHLAAALAAGAVAEVLLGSLGWALAVALLFSLHPLQTESVVYIAGRRDVLSGALGLTGLALWIRRGNPRAARSALLLWLAACCAKNSAVAWPLIAWAYDLFFPPPSAERRERAVAAAAPAAAAAVLVLYSVHFSTQLSRGPRAAGAALWYGGSALAQWATEPRLLLRAVRLIVWPFPQAADYSARAIEASASFADHRTLAALALLSALTAAAFVAARRDRVLGFALSLAALAYLPMTHLVPAVHNQEVFAEHWLYLPLFGAALAAARVLQSIRSRRAAAAAAALALFCAVACAARARVWRDDLTFWSEAARAQPLCARAQDGLALALRARGDLARAEELHRRAVELSPDDLRHRMNLSGRLIEEERYDEARALLREERTAAAGSSYFYQVAAQRGLLEMRAGNAAEAARILDSALPGNAAARDLRAWSIAGTKGWPAAVVPFRNAVWTDPGNGGIRADLGLALLNAGRPEEAAVELAEARRLAPGNLNAEFELGRALTQLRRTADARSLLTDVHRKEPGSEPVMIALSENEHRAGLRRAAIAWARRAISAGGSAEAYGQLARVSD